jgi:predicted nucleic acid-binding protein
MGFVFPDTFYFLALLNERDAAHDKAAQFGATSPALLTTAWVLTEVADACLCPKTAPSFWSYSIR